MRRRYQTYSFYGFLVFVCVSLCGSVAYAATNKTLTNNLTVQGKFQSQGTTTGPTPTAATHLTTKGYADRMFVSPAWKGYTSTTTGGNGGIEGMNADCDAAYSGSHACTFTDIIRLGTSYPYSSNAWVVDGSYATVYGTVSAGANQITKDGYELTNGANPFNPMCAGWTQGTSSYSGPIIQTSGNMSIRSCNTSVAVPCCQ